MMFAQRFYGLKPYVPGEQPADRQYIKLNANENAYPPSSVVQTALQNFEYEKLAAYPDPDSNDLRAAIAEALNKTNGVFCQAHDKIPQCEINLSPDMIFCGNGSDEVLSFVFYAFFDSKKPLLIPEHTYSFYPVYAGYYDIPLQKIPLLPDFSLDTETLVKTDSSGVIFANPNAPTSLLLSASKIHEMLQNYPRDKVMVVDEAYVDFAGETVLPLLAEFDNLLVIRTFSKGMSFAGMRLGYAVGNPKLIQALTVVKNSFNHFPVDRLCQELGIAACADYQHYCDNNSRIIKTRDWFAARLRDDGWNVLPSRTNFVFVSKPGLSGKTIYEKVKEQGILIRHFALPGIENFVRITIGTDAEMEILEKVLIAID